MFKCYCIRGWRGKCSSYYKHSQTIQDTGRETYTMAAYAKTKIFYISVGFWLILGEYLIVLCLFLIDRVYNATFYAKLFVLLLPCFMWRLNRLRSESLLSLDIIKVIRAVYVCLGVESYSGGSNQTITIQTGGSVTIPCHYDKKYTQQKKYWFSEIDKTYRNTTEKNLSVIDDPDQSLFTVTMRNLQNKHTGQYYCVVDIEGTLTITYEVYIKVQSGKRF